MPRPLDPGSNPGRRYSRRTVAGVMAAAAGGRAMGGHRALAQTATPAASPAAGGWSFTDGGGKTVTLERPPARIVADLNVAAALWDFGVRPIAVSGWTVTTDAAWGNVDRSVPVINAGPESGEPDLEQLLALEPDLFVTLVWAADDPNEYYNWTFTSPEQYQRAEAIMPVIGLSGTGSADLNMQRIVELAASVGADLETPEVTAARETYEATVEQFRQLAAEKSELVASFVAINSEAQYVANWPDWTDLSMFQALGLNIVTPDIDPGQYWETLSQEQANTYPADVLFQSSRAEGLSLQEMRDSPIYGLLPAVMADQLGVWNQDCILSYQGLTASLTNVIDTLATAEKVIEE